MCFSGGKKQLSCICLPVITPGPCVCCVKIKCWVLFRGKNISVALQLSVSRLNIPFTDDIVFYFVFFLWWESVKDFFSSLYLWSNSCGNKSAHKPRSLRPWRMAVFLYWLPLKYYLLTNIWNTEDTAELFHGPMHRKKCWEIHLLIYCSSIAVSVFPGL